MIDFTKVRNLSRADAVPALRAQVGGQRRLLDALRARREALDGKIAWREARVARLVDALERAERAQ